MVDREEDVGEAGFYALVERHFGFLESEHRFGRPRCADTGKHQYVKYPGRHLTIMVEHDRYLVLDVLIELAAGGNVIDIKDVYEVLGVTNETVFEQEGGMVPEVVDLALGRLASNLREYGGAVLREDRDLVKALRRRRSVDTWRASVAAIFVRLRSRRCR